MYLHRCVDWLLKIPLVIYVVFFILRARKPQIVADLNVKTEPCTTEQRLEVLESKIFQDMYKLYTDILHISKLTPEGIRVPAKTIRMKVLLPTENSSYYEYKGAKKVGKTWTLIDFSIQVLLISIDVYLLLVA